MNRREFFGKMIGGLAATAAVRQWPFRVFSFPTEIKPYALDSLAGLAYHHVNAQSGTWAGLDRTTYPGRLKVPIGPGNVKYSVIFVTRNGFVTAPSSLGRA